jgi:hypothetical protein
MALFLFIKKISNKMTRFEKILIDNGYIKYILNCKTMKYEITNKHTISTMVNLDHRYIHKTDEVILKKIEQDKSVMDDDFTWEDRKGVICFGLHEAGKPPTLISPRPKIIVKRQHYFNDEKIISLEDERLDDSMNLCLSIEEPIQIFKALFDSSICFNYDFT